MNRGNLVIYDLEGNIISQTGCAKGDLLEHTPPVGIPYIITSYEDGFNKIVLKIKDGVPVYGLPILSELEIAEQTKQNRIAELKALIDNKNYLGDSVTVERAELRILLGL